jgi:hypothetical protein
MNDASQHSKPPPTAAAAPGEKIYCWQLLQWEVACCAGSWHNNNNNPQERERKKQMMPHEELKNAFRSDFQAIFRELKVLEQKNVLFESKHLFENVWTFL